MPTPLPPPAPYVVGVDVAAESFVAVLATRPAAGSVQVLNAPKSFANTAAGFAALLAWADQHLRRVQNPAGVAFVLEATGVYHEELTYFLHHHHRTVQVVQPLMAKQFARSLATKSKTDALDAAMLARLGLERALPVWKPFTPALRLLRALTRERATGLKHATRLRNQLHALLHAHATPANQVARLQTHLDLLDDQKKEVEQELNALIASEKDLKKAVERIATIPGIGSQTALILLAETNGFAFFANARQLVSFAGLDVVHQQSGTSVRARPRLSKRGNTPLRTALYMPALAASRYNPQQKAFYERLRTRHPSGKAALCAVMRKLLVLAFSLHQSKEDYAQTRTTVTHKHQKIAPTQGAEATQDGPTCAETPFSATKVPENTRKIAELTP